MDKNYGLLKSLIECVSPSGSEESIRSLIEKEVKDFADEIYTDPLGNLIVHKKGKGKKVMLAAHMDEIGMMVTSIDDKGYIKVCSLGGNNPISVADHRVVFANGIEGALRWNAMENHGDLSFENLYIDIGTESKEETESKIKIGDICVLKSNYYESDSCIIGRSIDDRIGCYLLIEVIKKSIDTKHDLYYVFTVQEEVGCIGGKTAAFSIKPDIGIAVDVVPTGDVPSINGAYKDLPVKFGGGLSVRVKDGSFIANKALNKAIIEASKKENIRYQIDVLARAGTDASGMQQSGGGAVSTSLNMPMRYIHTANGMIYKEDIKEALKLLCVILKMNI
ncbi:M42 family metallopeptidase [Lutispora sp.]|uniref:M42 family metallopeptidase n=1 Tax=Lutispora sp. TaxID=2828727 RepID=UPI002B1FC57F|nr:M20/M25/M40 family metallo-hydrolase [Lutispora sp.]MEA4960587.1 M20/M25/M40 family metallo-hydrolase [Lutispora sp.]